MYIEDFKVFYSGETTEDIDENDTPMFGYIFNLNSQGIPQGFISGSLFIWASKCTEIVDECSIAEAIERIPGEETWAAFFAAVNSALPGANIRVQFLYHIEIEKYGTFADIFTIYTDGIFYNDITKEIDDAIQYLKQETK